MFFKNFKNKKVIVTGHTGFKGSWLSLWLYLSGAKVIGISDKTEKRSNYQALGLNKMVIFVGVHTDLQECIDNEGYGMMKLEDASHYFTKKTPKEVCTPQQQMQEGLNTTFELWSHYINNKNNLQRLV